MAAVEPGVGDGGDTKVRLLRAGERLFARHGIHRVRVREINDLAGQRNPSALHYHFGSRDGLVEAILLDHQLRVDAAIAARLDELEREAAGGRPSVRAVVDAAVRPLTAELRTESGRDFLRIVPQTVDALRANLRRGRSAPTTEATRRVLALIDDLLEPLPTAVRRERLVVYVLMITSILADRAYVIETGADSALDDDQFTAHLVDALEAALTAPSSVAF